MTFHFFKTLAITIWAGALALIGFETSNPTITVVNDSSAPVILDVQEIASASSTPIIKVIEPKKAVQITQTTPTPQIGGLIEEPQKTPEPTPVPVLIQVRDYTTPTPVPTPTPTPMPTETPVPTPSVIIVTAPFIMHEGFGESGAPYGVRVSVKFKGDWKNFNQKLRREDATLVLNQDMPRPSYQGEEELSVSPVLRFWDTSDKADDFSNPNQPIYAAGTYTWSIDIDGPIGSVTFTTQTK